MGEETNQGSGESPLKSGRSTKAAGDGLQNLDRVQAPNEVVGHDAVSRIECSSDEPGVEYRGTGVIGFDLDIVIWMLHF
jgi:hypothetical protein